MQRQTCKGRQETVRGQAEAGRAGVSHASDLSEAPSLGSQTQLNSSQPQKRFTKARLAKARPAKAGNKFNDVIQNLQAQASQTQRNTYYFIYLLC